MATNEIYIERPIPPLIADPKTASYLKEMSEKAVDIIENCIQSNFFLLVVFGGAMQQLWGMIRAIQMITLSATIRVSIPALMMLYMTICIEFAKMDIFSGEKYYEYYLKFKETPAPSE